MNKKRTSPKIRIATKRENRHGFYKERRARTNQELLNTAMLKKGHITLNVSLRIMDYTRKHDAQPMGWHGSSSMMVTVKSVAEAHEFHDKLTALCGRKP